MELPSFAKHMAIIAFLVSAIAERKNKPLAWLLIAAAIATAVFVKG
jgi:uncharacterized membrane protein AbrB (regulator of aidB expression)